MPSQRAPGGLFNVFVVTRKATYLRGLTAGRARVIGAAQDLSNSSLHSVPANDAVLQSPARPRSKWGVWIMQAFHTDGSGWPVPFGSMPSSRHARHGFSRRAFIGGAAAATGATLGSGLLSPAAALAWRSQPAPKPTTAITNIGGTDFHVTFFGPGVDPASITDFKGQASVAQVQAPI